MTVPDRPLRVLMLNDLPVTPGPGYGGAEVSLGRLVSGLEREGHVVHVHSRPRPRTGAGSVLARWDPGELRAVKRLVSSFRPDVVHAHNVLRELSPSVLLACRGLPVVMTVHDLRLVGIVQGLRSAPARLVDRFVKQPLDQRVVRGTVSRFTTVSEVAATVLRSRGVPAVVVPPPGPDAPPPVAPATECRDLLVVARLTPDKGVGVALEAFARIAGQFEEARLVVVGDGPEAPRLKELAERAVPGRVTFTGRLAGQDVLDQVSRARAVLVPSLPGIRPETSSLTAIEAATLARPVLASDDPAVAELVTSLGCGRVTPAGDVHALSTAMAEVLSQDDLVAGWAAAGARAAAERHSPAAVARAYVVEYVAAREQVLR
jgi:glycosyltransferase involved in cell wall biosynthesis